MKRRKMLLSALFMICALLPACGRSSDVGATDVTTSEIQAENEPALSSSAAVDSDTLTLQEKVESALVEGSSLPGVTYYLQKDGEAWVEINAERYCAGAVYPSAEWTPEAIAASYVDGSAPWVRDSSYVYCLWSPDYEHKFTVDYHHNNNSGHGCNWLYVDGYRTWPVEWLVEDISPDNLIQLYQTGEWSGKEWLCSRECPGVAVERINANGRPVYYYDVEGMTEDAAEAAESLIRSWDNVYLAEYDRAQTGCSVFFYPDSVDPYSLKFEDSYRDCREQKGTYFSFLERDSSKNWSRCTGARVELYNRGKLIQSWDLTPEKEFWGSDQSELIYEDGECYFFHRDTLWRLLDDGSVELVLKDIVGSDYFWDATIRAFYTQSGEVAFIPQLSEEEIARFTSQDE